MRLSAHGIRERAAERQFQKRYWLPDAGISSRECGVKDGVTIKAKVANRGSYSVHESVQVYIKHMDAADYEPGYQLKGIRNVY